MSLAAAVVNHSVCWPDCLAAYAAGIGVVSDEGHQRNLSGPLDGHPEGALVFGADAGAAARLNLSPLRNEPPNLVNLFVIDVLHVLYAESGGGGRLCPILQSRTIGAKEMALSNLDGLGV